MSAFRRRGEKTIIWAQRCTILKYASTMLKEMVQDIETNGEKRDELQPE